MGYEVELNEAQQMIAALEAKGERHPVNYMGRQVMWRRFGTGTPLVLLHGGHGSWLHWVRNIEALSTCRSVWVLDMPGYGDSDALDRGAGLKDMLAALMAMLDELFGDEHEIDLGGFSFGGFIASNLAVRRDTVRSLFTVGSGGHGGPRRETRTMINWRRSKTDEEREAAMRHNLEVHMLSRPENVDELALAIQTWSCVNTRFRSKEISRSGKLNDVLAKRDLPVFLLWGSEDVTAEPTFIIEHLTRGHPLRSGRIIEGAGHWAQYERADEVNDALLGWLARP